MSSGHPRFDRITRDPASMNGQPCVRGSRLTVRRVLEAMAAYPDRAQLLAEYPELEPDDVAQVLEFAAANLDDAFVDLQSRESIAGVDARGRTR